MRIALFTDTFAPQVNGVSLTLQRLVGHLTHRNIPFQVFAPECTTNPLFFRKQRSPFYQLAVLPLSRMPNRSSEYLVDSKSASSISNPI